MSRPKAFSLKKVAVQLVDEPPLYSEKQICSPMEAVALLSDVLKSYDREVVAVINMQSDLTPINMSIVSMGTLNSALASPREIMKCAILSNAASILLVHNHVSGRLVPSVNDIALTDKLLKACDLIDIPVQDHIIIGRRGDYFSFREKQILPLAPYRYAKELDEIDLKASVAEKQKGSVVEQLKGKREQKEESSQKRGDSSWKGLD